MLYYIFLIGILFGLLTYVEIYGPYIWITELSESETEFMGYGFYLLYYFILESLTQRSVAKFITGTKIVMANGSKPHVGIIFIRTLCRLIPFDSLTFFGERSRGWHDSLSKTYVVDVKRYKTATVLRNSFSEIGSEELQ